MHPGRQKAPPEKLGGIPCVFHKTAHEMARAQEASQVSSSKEVLLDPLRSKLSCPTGAGEFTTAQVEKRRPAKN